MLSLDAKLSGLLGDKTAKALHATFEMQTVADLLRHYPRRLDDRGALTDLTALRLGEHVTVLAKTLSVTSHPYVPRSGGRRAVRSEVVVTDGSDRLLLTFFRQPWRAGQLKAGTVAMFSGKVGMFRNQRQLTQPTFDVLGRGSSLGEFEDEQVARWWPIYAASAQISSKKIMESVALVLEQLDDVPDPLPAAVRAADDLIDLRQAFEQIHRPADPEQWHQARTRLRFEEAFVLQTVLAQRRHLTSAMPATSRPARPGGLRDRFDASLPFQLTTGQRAVGADLELDLVRAHPMHRLLQGEVGSGKTVVALRAMLQVVDGGGQCALLAPTEVLAAQHYRSLLSLLGPLAQRGMLGGDEAGTLVALLTGSTSAAPRRRALLEAASGDAGIVIGTHALLEAAVQFADLGLVVVDEQHRFGVEQRAALTSKGGATPPHVLVMTATPIPRTVAMTVFGDLDVSTLRELPAGRRATQTTVVPTSEHPQWLARAWQRVREEVAAGHQVYVVCPRIGADPESEMQEPEDDEDALPPRSPPVAVSEMAAELEQGALAGLRLRVVHGRLPADEKDDIMRSFSAGAVDVLVATTVIEVGVDVPNATVMVVMDADRFGVSQLHQLRGRVGRGSIEGLCLLVTDAPDGAPSRNRLEEVAATSDGFTLARLDLESRREGDVLGASQSGRRSGLRLLSVLRDEGVIEAAREVASSLVVDDPDLQSQPALAAAVARLHENEQADYLDRS